MKQTEASPHLFSEAKNSHLVELAWPNPEEVPMQVSVVQQPRYLGFKAVADPSSKIPDYQTSMREDFNQAVDGTMYFAITNATSVGPSISTLKRILPLSR